MLLPHHVKNWIGAVCWILSYAGLILLYHLVAGSTSV